MKSEKATVKHVSLQKSLLLSLNGRISEQPWVDWLDSGASLWRTSDIFHVFFLLFHIFAHTWIIAWRSLFHCCYSLCIAAMSHGGDMNPNAFFSAQWHDQCQHVLAPLFFFCEKQAQMMMEMKLDIFKCLATLQQNANERLHRDLRCQTPTISAFPSISILAKH